MQVYGWPSHSRLRRTKSLIANFNNSDKPLWRRNRLENHNRPSRNSSSRDFRTRFGRVSLCLILTNGSGQHLSGSGRAAPLLITGLPGFWGQGEGVYYMSAKFNLSVHSSVLNETEISIIMCCLFNIFLVFWMTKTVIFIMIFPSHLW